MSADPVVSVLCPVGLHGDKWTDVEWLRGALASVEADLRSIPHEVILVDDCSDPLAVAHLDDWRIAPHHLILRNETKWGLTRSLNRGLQAAKGTYIARIDADDLWIEGKTAAQIARYELQPALALSFGSMQLMDADGRELEFHNRAFDWTSAIAFAQQQACPVPHGSILARRDVLIALGGYPYAPLANHAEDFALWSRLARFFEIEGISTSLMRYRIHNTSVSRLFEKSQARSTQHITQTFRAYGDAMSYVNAVRRVQHELGPNPIAAGIRLSAAWERDGALPISPHLEADLRRVFFDRYVSRCTDGSGFDVIRH